jgi:hypothetical protein
MAEFLPRNYENVSCSHFVTGEKLRALIARARFYRVYLIAECLQRATFSLVRICKSLPGLSAAQ